MTNTLKVIIENRVTKKEQMWLGMVVQACNTRTEKTESGELL